MNPRLALEVIPLSLLILVAQPVLSSTGSTLGTGRHVSILDSLSAVPINRTSYDPNSNVSQGQPDIDWAVGAYSTNLGLSSYSGVWSRLASSYNEIGQLCSSGCFAAALLNVPYNATGVIKVQACSNVNFTVYGELFQAAIVYRSTHTYSIPSWEVLYMGRYSGSGSDQICGGPVYDSTANWGSSLASPVTQKVFYTTHNGFLGWWYTLTLSNGSSYYIAADPFGLTPSGTSSKQTAAGDSFDPSIALEVDEDPGQLFKFNSNFEIESNVGGQGYFSYGVSGPTGNGDTPGFDIGPSAPPNSTYANYPPYGSGLTYTPGVGSVQYLDEFGTSNGISGWMSTNWYISSPIKTLTANTNLPNLNSQTQHYLTMSAGTGGSVSPPSGYYMVTQPFTIQATASTGYYFSSWTGTGPGSYSSTGNPHSMSMGTGDISETANFGVQYYLTMQKTGLGSVTPSSGYYHSGSQVTIQAYPGARYYFCWWMGSGSGSTGNYDTSNPATITMNGAITETAVFQTSCPKLTGPGAPQAPLLGLSSP